MFIRSLDGVCHVFWCKTHLSLLGRDASLLVIPILYIPSLLRTDADPLGSSLQVVFLLNDICMGLPFFPLHQNVDNPRSDVSKESRHVCTNIWKSLRTANDQPGMAGCLSEFFTFVEVCVYLVLEVLSSLFP